MSPFGSATLILQGPSGKLKFEITGDRTTVGRTRDNEIVLQDPAVSSHHCEFVADKTGLSVRDLNSSNGTYVNGRRVQAGPVYDGDALKIGQYQGRIAVRKLDGTPLKAPGVGGPAVFVGIAVGLILIAGGGGAWWVMQKKAADKALFGEYEKKAKEVLGIEPCTGVDDPLRRVRAMEQRLDKPELGKRGKLAKAERAKDEELLAASKRREPLLEQVVKQVAASVERQKDGLEELKQYQGRFNDPELVSALKALDQVFAERGQAGEEFAEGLKKYSSQVTEFNGLLDKLVQAGDRDAADQLDGWRYKADPQRLLDECQTRFGKSQRDGLLKLAGVTL